MFLSVADGSHEIQTLFIVLHIVDGLNEAIYLRYNFLKKVNLRDLEKRLYVSMISCSFSLVFSILTMKHAFML